jgi:hypothetical protein
MARQVKLLPPDGKGKMAAGGMAKEDGWWRHDVQDEGRREV